MKADDRDVVILLLYVDDIILIGFNAAKVQKVVQDFASVFDLKDIGKLTYFLGYRFIIEKMETYLLINPST